MMIKKITYQETWGIRHTVMWPDQPLAYVQLPNDKEGVHYGLFNTEELVSVISVFIEKDTAQFRKFATRVAAQGKGYGSILLSHVIHELQAQHVTRIWCNARKNKTFFYERFGMQRTDHTFTKNGMDYVIMEKIIETNADMQ